MKTRLLILISFLLTVNLAFPLQKGRTEKEKTSSENITRFIFFKLNIEPGSEEEELFKNKTLALANDPGVKEMGWVKLKESKTEYTHGLRIVFYNEAAIDPYVKSEAHMEVVKDVWKPVVGPAQIFDYVEPEVAASSCNGDIDAEGFVSLFNGKDFNNWQLLLRDGNADEIKLVYSIDEDGTLHFFRDLPAGSGFEERKNAFHGVMATNKSYKRYHLKFEYKWGKKLVNNSHQFQYDAGVFYHISQLKVFPIGLQYQVRYNHLTNKNHSVDFWAAGVDMQWYSEDGKTFQLPSKGGEPQSIRHWEHRAISNSLFHGLDDGWNVCELIVMGNEYAIHKLNGEVVNVATNLENGEGPIALEAETGEIFWRNIKIKEWDQTIPINQFLNEEF